MEDDANRGKTDLARDMCAMHENKSVRHTGKPTSALVPEKGLKMCVATPPGGVDALHLFYPRGTTNFGKQV